jgi:aspartyl/asparaginyl-tRNA synthetase
MSQYRSAMGRVVDMDALATRNEHVRAVGNMKVNSRGDSIDALGNVIKPITEKVNEQYAKTVTTAGSQVRKKTPPPAPKIEPVELTEAEKQLEAEFEDDIEVEKIKSAEVKKGKK